MNQLSADSDRPEPGFNAAIIEGVSAVTHLVPDSDTLLGKREYYVVVSWIISIVKVSLLPIALSSPLLGDSWGCVWVSQMLNT